MSNSLPELDPGQVQGFAQELALSRNLDEDWRVIRALNFYRWILAVGMGTLAMTGVMDDLFDVMWPALFTGAWAAYLVLCIPSAVAAHWRRPGLRLQIYVLVAIDLAFVTALVFSSTGVNSGLGMLLIAPIAGASILVPSRVAALLAAVASLTLLGQEVFRELFYIGQSVSFAQAGILGILLFITAGAANSLALRARRSAALAASRKSELDDMAALNERIIQRMQIGLVVLDEQRHIRQLNHAARLMLDLPANSNGQSLSALASPLSNALQTWQAGPQAAVEAFDSGKFSLLPTFTPLGQEQNSNRNTPILIFLEDAQRASEQAQQMKLVALGHLTASIAHEIRNPLSAISHASQLLDESTHLDGDDHRLLDIVQRHTGRIDDIVKSVLGLSRRDKTTPEPIKLGEWLDAAIKDYIQGRQDAPNFKVAPIADDLTIYFDANQFRQILFNLWENAERHARSKDRELRVSLSVGQDRQGTHLDIADNGPGLQGHKFTQLVEPFFTTTSEGTGLGLYIVRELCASNNARLELAPAAQNRNGACFRINFSPAPKWQAVHQTNEAVAKPKTDQMASQRP